VDCGHTRAKKTFSVFCFEVAENIHPFDSVFFEIGRCRGVGASDPHVRESFEGLGRCFELFCKAKQLKYHTAKLFEKRSVKAHVPNMLG